MAQDAELGARIEASPRARFGSGVSEAIIRDAETVLKVSFPESYRWWLGQYGAGFLGGYELQGLAPVKPSERVVGDTFVGDVVATALQNRARGLPDHLLEILNYEGDEIYFLDLSRRVHAECPVVCQRADSEGLEEVAASFKSFLEKEL